MDDTLQNIRKTAIAISMVAISARVCSGAESRTVVQPAELAAAVLHNPDMGWVVYENYPLDQDPHGSSTLLTLPDEDFAGVDTVAIMFSWQDVEKLPGEYDFSKVDFAYDYWAKRGKAIQLRVSATTLMWWANRTPPAGKGAPDYVREHLRADEKQMRDMAGVAYEVEDVDNAYYEDRLAKFLRAVDAHFSATRPVTLVDLRGFGAWGEWHSGFKYASVEERRAALKKVIDTWCDALPHRTLALSASFDPDSPKELYEGGTHEYDAKFTSHYRDFLNYSALDYALTKPNISFRRDGCGGAVHSNERKLIEEAFQLGRGPMFSEFVDGYNQAKPGGAKWLQWKIDDALSLHPNYVCLLGWQAGDALAFVHEQNELVEHGAKRMGYRLVPTRVSYPSVVIGQDACDIEIEWTNRGVGRALANYELVAALVNAEGTAVATASGGRVPTSRWVANEQYSVDAALTFAGASSGNYDLTIGLVDRRTARPIELPLERCTSRGLYRIGAITIR
ncbi:MAG TPA: DUF4832 domain-containing protein [Lacipirellulaceae bacterium]|jgi:hypothetical protein|nr:DUF4832 domain-containing protein [Lacipirellulaceae bacterium]